jgi:hypothetical protein
MEMERDNLITDCLSRPWTYSIRTWKKVYQLSFLQGGGCYMIAIIMYIL